MYKEDLEGFERTERTPRAYVSASSPIDAENLLRENERLKKNLEKEKFFNKLLDKELQEVKAEAATRFPAEYAPPSRGISKGAFYTVLILAIALAGLLFFTLYNDKEYNSFEQSVTTSVQENDPAPADNEPTTNVNTGDLPSSSAAAAGAVKDSAEIIMKNATAAKSAPPVVPPVTQEKKPSPEASKAAAASQKKYEDYSEAEVEALINETPPKKPANTVANTNAANKSAASPEKSVTPVAETKPANETATQAPAVASRPVIGKYKVTSKANFYNNADENTLRSTFISGNSNKTVEALEDKNGFIYVEYKNDNGLVSRGWLSKTDLSKIE